MIWALLMGSLSMIASCVGALSDPTRFFQSYLFSYMFWIDVTLGSLLLLMIYPLTGGTWGAATRRIIQASTSTLSWMTLLFLPIVFGMSKIYPWLDPAQMNDPKIVHKAAYLNIPAFCLRAAFYFAVWNALNYFTSRWSRGVEKEGDILTQAKLRSLSAGGLVAYALTASFASFDWQMSLEPRWYSTIYGMIYCSAQALSAFSFALIVFVAVTRKTENEKLFPVKTRRDLGSLLLTMVIVWAYLTFMQYLVIWMGNLPEEATWFVHRVHGGWQVLAVLLITFQFGLPFCALLFRNSKDNLQNLAIIAWVVFLLRIVDRYWNIMPSLYPSRVAVHWQDLLTFIGIGGFWMTAFIRTLKRYPLFATQDTDWPAQPIQEAHLDA